MKPVILLALFAAVMAAAGAANAQSTPDQSGPPPICTDRPTKANSTCTVPQGDWQVESDVVNWQQTSVGGVTTDMTVAPTPTLKYGLTKTVDVEVNWAPWQEVRIKAGGVTTTASGASDVFFRVKWAMVSNSSWSASGIAWVKAPTASHMLGNGRVEEGFTVPFTFNLPNKFSLTVEPELDGLENAALNGQHANLINVASLSRPVTDKLTLSADLWNQQNFDPGGTISQTTADVAAAYLVTNTLQLDAGANFGVNRFAPRTQLYLGVSKRW
jgi:hypothetical protein